MTTLKKILSYLIPIRVLKTQSSFNPQLEVNLVKGQLVLDSEYANYSFGGLHKVFKKGFEKISIQSRKINKVLVLGFGAGSVAHILHNEYNFKGKITGVEIDHEVIALSKKYLGLDKLKSVNIVIDEASGFIKKHKRTYDLIVVDVYNDRLVPDSCQDEAFVSGLSQLLMKGGLIVFNKMIFNKKTNDEAENLVDLFMKYYPKVNVLKLHLKSTNWLIAAE